MPMRNRKVLTPMWLIEGELYGFNEYLEARSQSNAPPQRVWVGIEPEKASHQEIDFEENREWIFPSCDKCLAYRAVKEYNQKKQQSQVNLTKG